jgi:hypothetical protein
MLNLRELEEKLDAALANETTESLTYWIEQKRFKSFLNTLGEGNLCDMDSTIIGYEVTQITAHNFNLEAEIIVGNSYALAA